VRRALARGGLAALALAAPAPAAAHVTIAPAESRPADLQRYRLLVPNESTSGKATVGVDVRLPPGITFALVDAQPPWRAKLVRSGGQIRQISWSGGRIPPDGYGELYFLARNPVRQGEAAFKTLQRYEGGQVTRWIGGPDSDNPSPSVSVSERATPQDVVSVHGEKPATAAAKTAAPAPAVAKADDGNAASTIALVAALVAVALAAAALVLRRRT
jgi:uncharacterized protein YcnI